ncbi:MAG: circadian clock protein KaiC [Anaerolineae bacterium]|nr:circadian clock protein KaiC [Anaerolineae bacterium]MCB0225022.1 circadian clock protein KaiC [Anaerolineae bacterium]MCB9103448.1 circadian clock protein KaiC [Anaerolineales bacterium]
MEELKNLQVLQKTPTGIEGFEHLTIGGLPKGRTTLMVGSSGSGKTIFAIEFLYRGITEFNRPGVFVTFEERAPDIVQNVKSMRWHLDELVQQGQLLFVDGSPELEPVEETGSYDLSGLIVQIKYAVEKIKAKQVVLDSIGSLFHQFSNANVIRREIFRITEVLKEMDVTAIMTAERLEEYGPISRYGIEEFVADNVIVLRNVLHQEKIRRTIQILKVRGSSHAQGEFPITISDSGIKILPLSAIELQQESSDYRITTGNEELDQMTSGGIFHDSIFLVSGPTGSGKTLISTMFTAAGCRNKERVLLLAYEESRDQLLRNARSWGIDFEPWENDGLLRIVCTYPETMGLEDHLLTVRKEIENFRPQRLVVDSVSAMERVASVRNFREFVIGLTSYVKKERVCSLFTSTTPQLSGGESITEAHISTITDVIALLRYVEVQGVMRRGIAVIKMRGSQHEKNVREFNIDGQGLHIGLPFKNVENIILGIPARTTLSEVDQLGDMFE